MVDNICMLRSMPGSISGGNLNQCDGYNSIDCVYGLHTFIRLIQNPITDVRYLCMEFCNDGIKPSRLDIHGSNPQATTSFVLDITDCNSSLAFNI